MTSNDCKTRYPVVLIHGAGFRDLKWPVYWGRIPAALEKRGARIFYGLQDSWGSVETNAEAVARRIDGILAESGAQKVNLIAHSKGGLDARMAVSRFRVSFDKLLEKHTDLLDRLYPDNPEIVAEVIGHMIRNLTLVLCSIW